METHRQEGDRTNENHYSVYGNACSCEGSMLLHHGCSNHYLTRYSLYPFIMYSLCYNYDVLLS
jgi:hypothetical protein